MAESLITPRVDFRERAFCLGCGYALRGLVERRCPECGRGFDPFDPWTMRVPGVTDRRPSKPVPFAVGIILCTLFVAGASIDGMVAAASGVCLFSIIGWAGIVWVWRKRNRAERAAAARGETLPGTRHWRSVVVGLLGLTLLSGIGYHRCPHGRYYRYGPVSLFHGQHPGGPCRNYVLGMRFEMTPKWYLIVS